MLNEEKEVAEAVSASESVVADAECAHLARTLRLVRLEKGLTQTQAADLIGVCTGTLHNWEKSHRINGAQQAQNVRSAIALLRASETVLRSGRHVPRSTRVLTAELCLSAPYTLVMLHAMLQVAAENNVNATKFALNYLENVLAQNSKTEGE